MILYFGLSAALILGIIWTINMIKNAPIIEEYPYDKDKKQ